MVIGVCVTVLVASVVFAVDLALAVWREWAELRAARRRARARRDARW